MNDAGKRCQLGLSSVKEIALRLAAGDDDPLELASAIYWAASNADAFAFDDDPHCEELASIGTQFLQLADELEAKQDNLATRASLIADIREAARAWLANNPEDAEVISIGPIGPIRILEKDDSRLKASRRASRIAQSATTCDDLIHLVSSHPNPQVRMEAVPRLKARFPDNASAQDALIKAVTDPDEGVRCEAISAVADIALPGAGDLLAAALSDEEPDVRFFAAIGLQKLDDPRAPIDPESFAYGITS